VHRSYELGVLYEFTVVAKSDTERRRFELDALLRYLLRAPYVHRAHAKTLEPTPLVHTTRAHCRVSGLPRIHTCMQP
jgi:hypothetical protein